MHLRSVYDERGKNIQWRKDSLPNKVLRKLDSFPTGSSGKESSWQCRRHKRHGFSSWTMKIPLRRKWQHTPVILPGESHGQRSLVCYRSQGCKETQLKWLSMHTHSHRETHKTLRLEHLFTKYAKINLKWIKNLNIRLETIIFLEGNTRRAPFDINHSMWDVFLRETPKAGTIKDMDLL